MSIFEHYKIFKLPYIMINKVENRNHNDKRSQIKTSNKIKCHKTPKQKYRKNAINAVVAGRKHRPYGEGRYEQVGLEM